MKKAISILICISIILSISYVTLAESNGKIANEDIEYSSPSDNTTTITKYTDALTNNSWKISGIPSTDFSDTLNYFYELIQRNGGIIQLPNQAIQLFESPSGQIYMLYSYPLNDTLQDVVVAELIFNYDMTSFILYSDGKAIIFSKLE